MSATNDLIDVADTTCESHTEASVPDDDLPLRATVCLPGLMELTFGTEAHVIGAKSFDHLADTLTQGSLEILRLLRQHGFESESGGPETVGQTVSIVEFCLGWATAMRQFAKHELTIKGSF